MLLKMKRLSIIVPVYNVEKYLAKCLDSLLHQDIPASEYEIIVINDGSTDGSLDIANEYSLKYQTLRIISQPNSGLGAARNTGIRSAEGNCLFFVDSDDYIQENSIRSILEAFESKKLEALRFNYMPVKESGEIIPKKGNATFNVFFSEKVVDGETFLSEYLGWSCYVWSFLFDRSYIIENELFFIENLYIEDVEWLIRFMPQVKRVCSIDLQIYYYLLRVGSITQNIQTDKSKKLINDGLFVLNKLHLLSKETKNRKTRLWAKGMISFSVMWILTFLSKESAERKKEIIKNLKSEGIIPLKAYHFTLKQWFDLIMINLSPSMYCYFRKK